MGRQHAGPVETGQFPDGTDRLLWNPYISDQRWRGERLRAIASPRALSSSLLAVVVLAAGYGFASGFARALVTVLAVLALCVAALEAWINEWFFTTEHRHPRGRKCHLERVPGEYFFRTRHLQCCGVGMANTVEELFAVVDELANSPVRAWLDPELPRIVHRVAWELVRGLHQVCPARELLEQLATTTETSHLAAEAHWSVEAVDHALARILSHLRACVVLTRHWEAKLHHNDLAARAHAMVVPVTTDNLHHVLDTAEDLPRAVYASVAAAREITGTGPFRWEQPPPGTGASSSEAAPHLSSDQLSSPDTASPAARDSEEQT